MRRWIVATAVLALVAAACGGAQVEERFSEVSPSITTAPSSTTTPSDTGDAGATSSSSTTSSTAAPVVVDGPPAPDFTLVLGEGEGEFTLSAEQKPVYLVFWAEW